MDDICTHVISGCGVADFHPLQANTALLLIQLVRATQYGGYQYSQQLHIIKI